VDERTGRALLAPLARHGPFDLTALRTAPANDVRRYVEASKPLLDNRVALLGGYGPQHLGDAEIDWRHAARATCRGRRTSVATLGSLPSPTPTFCREAFGQGDFPFCVVQLPEHKPKATAPAESELAELRDGQAHAAEAVPNVGLVVTLVLGQADDVHPRNKRDVGGRVARSALNHVYGRPDAGATSPAFDPAGVKIDGRAVRVAFKNVGGGLVTTDGRPPRAFTLAGADRQWHVAEARLEGDGVVLTAAAVPRPVAVRYAWADNPDFNLVSKDGLPVAPFRTDDWPGNTFNAR
jgi:hypothetical protein